MIKLDKDRLSEVLYSITSVLNSLAYRINAIEDKLDMYNSGDHLSSEIESINESIREIQLG